jgi:hypothetical protein
LEEITRWSLPSREIYDIVLVRDDLVDGLRTGVRASRLRRAERQTFVIVDRLCDRGINESRMRTVAPEVALSNEGLSGKMLDQSVSNVAKALELERARASAAVRARVQAERARAEAEQARDQAERWLATIQGSASWRITAPLRAAMRALRRVRSALRGPA